MHASRRSWTWICLKQVLVIIQIFLQISEIPAILDNYSGVRESSSSIIELFLNQNFYDFGKQTIDS